MNSRYKNLILLTQKYPFEHGEEFLEGELYYLAKRYQVIYLIPTGARNFARQRDVPGNVKIVKIDNPANAKDILRVFIHGLPKFLPLFFRELKSSKLSGHAFKYLIYHIPFALKIKAQIKELIQPGQEYSFYSYWMDTNAYALALLKKKNPSYQFFIRSHGGDLYNERHPTGHILFREMVYDQASLIAPVSANGTSYILRHWPEYGHKVKTFFLGVDKQPIGPIGEGNIYRVVSCSSLIPLKRVEKILEVVKLLQIKTEWVHFGGAEAEVSRLKTLAEDVSLPASKLIARGHTDHKELMAFYRSTPCDLFINLSESEGIPVSIMEAISFGIPVLANNVGGVSEIVTDQINILVHVDDNPELIAQKIEAFFQSGDSRSKIVRQLVREFWNSKFNAERNYTLFMEEVKNYNCEV